MNQYQRALMVQRSGGDLGKGMGLIFPEEPAAQGGVFNGGGSGGGDFNWDNLMRASALTLSTIFGKPNNVAAFQQPTNTNTLSVADQLALYEAQRRAAKGDGDESSAAVSSRGIRIGEDTYISWPVIGLVGVGVMLLQSQGFQRRGR